MKRTMFKSMCTAFVLTLVFSFLPFQTVCENLTHDVLRLHILANSDTDRDQEIKLLVRDEITMECGSLFENADSLEEAEKVASENLELFKETAERVIREKGENYEVSVRLCPVYFNTRYYGEITMPAGKYMALQIEIGKAQGQNWWCVLFPSLCFGTSAKCDDFKDDLTEPERTVVSSGTRYQFRFKIVEALSGIFELLGF